MIFEHADPRAGRTVREYLARVDDDRVEIELSVEDDEGGDPRVWKTVLERVE